MAGVDFTPILPQFRLNEGKIDLVKDFSLRLSRDVFLVSKDAVFVYLKAFLHPEHANRDVVGLRPCEIVKSGPITLIGHDSQVHWTPERSITVDRVSPWATTFSTFS